MKVAILKNENPFDHHLWVTACENDNEGLVYKVIDITKSDWLDLLLPFKPDVCLLKPPDKTSLFRQLYQERVEIITRDLGWKSFPSYDELRIYENKRYFSYWLKAHNLPHAKTWVFYNEKEASKFANNISFPIVAKMNIGASGNGVSIIRDKGSLDLYIQKAFSVGLMARIGPKLEKGNIVARAWSLAGNFNKLKNKLKIYSDIAADKQIGFVIFQEFVQHDFEWRAVRIGDSFFAHKKLKHGDKTSGSLLKDYGAPPLILFDFIKGITDRFEFRSVAIDFFEVTDGSYLINEIQCIFGQSDPYQMLVDNIPGRYQFVEGEWIFESGDFNANESFNLRLKEVKQSHK